MTQHTLTRDEWDKRFVEVFVGILMKPLTDEEQAKYHGDPEWEPWTVEAATSAAHSELEAIPDEEKLEETPEWVVDECLSAWSE